MTQSTMSIDSIQDYTFCSIFYPEQCATFVTTVFMQAFRVVLIRKVKLKQ